MKIKFKPSPPFGKDATVQFERGVWFLVDGDPDALSEIEIAEIELVGNYFPTAWDKAEAIAKFVGGELIGTRQEKSVTVGRVF